MTKEKNIGKKLQEIRSKLGRVVVCQVGVRDDGEFDILAAKTAIPFDEEESINENREEDTKKVLYIG